VKASTVNPKPAADDALPKKPCAEGNLTRTDDQKMAANVVAGPRNVLSQGGRKMDVESPALREPPKPKPPKKQGLSFGALYAMVKKNNDDPSRNPPAKRARLLEKEEGEISDEEERLEVRPSSGVARSYEVSEVRAGARVPVPFAATKSEVRVNNEPADEASSAKRKRAEDDTEEVESPAFPTPKRSRAEETASSLLSSPALLPKTLTQLRHADKKNVLGLSVRGFDLTEVLFSGHFRFRVERRLGDKTDRELKLLMQRGTVEDDKKHGGYRIEFLDARGVKHHFPFHFLKSGKAEVKTYIAHSPLRLPEHKGRRNMMWGMLQLLAVMLDVPVQGVGPYIARLITEHEPEILQLAAGTEKVWILVNKILPTKEEIEILKQFGRYAIEMGEVEEWIVSVGNQLNWVSWKVNAWLDFWCRWETQKKENEETTHPLPPGWTKTDDPESGKSYYFNEEMRKTQWERPSVIDSGGKIFVEETTGKCFYANSVTGTTQWWECPAEEPAEDA
jgi:hypothetical protein